MEISVFFAARTVFFLMLVIDYLNVSYYNNGVERLIGVLGTVVASIFAFIDFCGFMNILVLENVDAGYIIKGNEENFLASVIKPFKAQYYVFVSFLSLVVVVGLETFNYGVRGKVKDKVSTKEIKSTKTA